MKNDSPLRRQEEPKQPTPSSYETLFPYEGASAQEMIQFLQKEIVRREQVIAKLKEENALLLKTALRQANEKNEMMQKVRELEKALANDQQSLSSAGTSGQHHEKSKSQD
ncbi:MAG: hypothetical protein QW594_00155 [Candidatus Woesearchaeota archaeon]